MESSLINLEMLPATERKFAAKLLLRMGYDLYLKHIPGYESNLSKFLQLFENNEDRIELKDFLESKAFEAMNDVPMVQKLSKRDRHQLLCNADVNRKLDWFTEALQCEKGDKYSYSDIIKASNNDSDVEKSNVNLHYHINKPDRTYNIENEYLLSDNSQINIYQQDDFTQQQLMKIQEYNPKNHHLTNSLFKYPFIDRTGSMKDILTSQIYINTSFCDIKSTTLQKRMAKFVYDKFNNTNNLKGMLLIDVLKGLNMLRLSYPDELKKSIKKYSYKQLDSSDEETSESENLNKNIYNNRAVATITEQQWFDIINRCVSLEKHARRKRLKISDDSFENNSLKFENKYNDNIKNTGTLSPSPETNNYDQYDNMMSPAVAEHIEDKFVSKPSTWHQYIRKSKKTKKTEEINNENDISKVNKKINNSSLHASVEKTNKSYDISKKSYVDPPYGISNFNPFQKDCIEHNNIKVTNNDQGNQNNEMYITSSSEIGKMDKYNNKHIHDSNDNNLHTKSYARGKDYNRFLDSLRESYNQSNDMKPPINTSLSPPEPLPSRQEFMPFFVNFDNKISRKRSGSSSRTDKSSYLSHESRDNKSLLHSNRRSIESSAGPSSNTNISSSSAIRHQDPNTSVKRNSHDFKVQIDNNTTNNNSEKSPPSGGIRWFASMTQQPAYVQNHKKSSSSSTLYHDYKTFKTEDLRFKDWKAQHTRTTNSSYRNVKSIIANEVKRDKLKFLHSKMVHTKDSLNTIRNKFLQETADNDMLIKNKTNTNSSVHEHYHEGKNMYIEQNPNMTEYEVSNSPQQQRILLDKYDNDSHSPDNTNNYTQEYFDDDEDSEDDIISNDTFDSNLNEINEKFIGKSNISQNEAVNAQYRSHQQTNKNRFISSTSNHRIKNENFFQYGTVNNSQNIVIVHKPQIAKKDTEESTTALNDRNNIQKIYNQAHRTVYNARPKSQIILTNSPNWTVHNHGLVADFSHTQVEIVTAPVTSYSTAVTYAEETTTDELEQDNAHTIAIDSLASTTRITSPVLAAYTPSIDNARDGGFNSTAVTLHDSCAESNIDDDDDDDDDLSKNSNSKSVHHSNDEIVVTDNVSNEILDKITIITNDHNESTQHVVQITTSDSVVDSVEFEDDMKKLKLDDLIIPTLNMDDNNKSFVNPSDETFQTDASENIDSVAIDEFQSCKVSPVYNSSHQKAFNNHTDEYPTVNNLHVNIDESDLNELESEDDDDMFLDEELIKIDELMMKTKLNTSVASFSNDILSNNISPNKNLHVITESTDSYEISHPNNNPASPSENSMKNILTDNSLSSAISRERQGISSASPVNSHSSADINTARNISHSDSSADINTARSTSQSDSSADINTARSTSHSEFIQEIIADEFNGSSSSSKKNLEDEDDPQDWSLLSPIRRGSSLRK